MTQGLLNKIYPLLSDQETTQYSLANKMYKYKVCAQKVGKKNINTLWHR